MIYTNVLAAVGNPVLDPALQGETGISFIQGFLPRMISLLIIIGGIGFFFMFIIGAVRWITSGGDKAQTESARSQITQALAGLVVLFSAWAVATLVKSLFGIDVLNFDLSTVIV